jgi:hypothetical protein
MRGRAIESRGCLVMSLEHAHSSVLSGGAIVSHDTQIRIVRDRGKVQPNIQTF